MSDIESYREPWDKAVAPRELERRRPSYNEAQEAEKFVPRWRMGLIACLAGLAMFGGTVIEALVFFDRRHAWAAAPFLVLLWFARYCKRRGELLAEIVYLYKHYER